jgi:hypothetical protein
MNILLVKLINPHSFNNKIEKYKKLKIYKKFKINSILKKYYLLVYQYN